MIKLITLVFAGVLCTSAFAQDVDATDVPDEMTVEVFLASDVTLDDFLWEKRLIVVFADSDRDPSFRKQIEFLLERPLPLLERDVVVITDTDPKGLSDIRKELRPRGFGFVLVDKDGVVKLRKPTPWDVREITRSIDKTELRQQEVIDERIAR